MYVHSNTHPPSPPLQQRWRRRLMVQALKLPPLATWTKHHHHHRFLNCERADCGGAPTPEPDVGLLGNTNIMRRESAR